LVSLKLIDQIVNIARARRHHRRSVQLAMLKRIESERREF